MLNGVKAMLDACMLDFGRGKTKKNNCHSVNSY